MKIIYALCLLLILGFATAALGQIPAMPEIPVALPDPVREPLIIKRKPWAEEKLRLLNEGQALNQDCQHLEGGSDRHKACLARKAKFEGQVTALRKAFAALQTEIDDAIDAEIARLEARDKELTAALEKDAEAIRNLGFARRAEDFAEWEKLGADAKSAFEKELVDAATDQVVGKITDHLTDSFKNFDAATANRWISQLNKMGAKPERLIELIRKVGNAADKALVIDDAKEILTSIERLQAASSANSREDMLLLSMDLFCDLVPPPGNESCNAFKTVGKLTFASLYNNAARRVAMNEVERLTTMTEQQLLALAKINELVVKHVKERNDVRANLKALE